MDVRVIWVILIVGLGGVLPLKQGCLPGCNCGSAGSKGVPSYKVLACEKFPTTEIPRSVIAFRALESPKAITRQSFIPMKPTALNTLDLCYSGIQSIDDGSLTDLVQLTVLKLSGNQLSSINTNTFYGCKNLRELYLDNSHVHTLGEDCFYRLGKLKALFLQNNNLRTLPHLPNSITKLDVSNNHIGPTLGDYRFTENLQYLDLCGNQLTSLSAVCFAKAPLRSLCSPRSPQQINKEDSWVKNLQNLTLVANTQGDQLDNQELNQTKYLQHLTLISYHIDNVNFLADKMLVSLRLNDVTLSENIEQAFLRILGQIFTLEVLDVSYSPQLASIILNSTDLWLWLTRLTLVGLSNTNQPTLGNLHGHGIKMSVDLSDNPLRCDCNLARKLQTDVGLAGNTSATTCATPPSYAGRQLRLVLHELCQDDNKINAFSTGKGSNQISQGQASTKDVEEIPPDDEGEPEYGNNDNGNVNTDYQDPKQQPVPQDNVYPEQPDNEFENEEEPPDDPENPIGREIDTPLNPITGETPAHIESPGHVTDDKEVEGEKNEGSININHGSEEEYKPEAAKYNFTDDFNSLLHQKDPDENKDSYVIIGIAVAIVTVVGAVIFSVLFFYYRRRGIVGTPSGNAHAQYNVHQDTKSSPSKGVKN